MIKRVKLNINDIEKESPKDVLSSIYVSEIIYVNFEQNSNNMNNILINNNIQKYIIEDFEFIYDRYFHEITEIEHIGKLSKYNIYIDNNNILNKNEYIIFDNKNEIYSLIKNLNRTKKLKNII